MTYGNHIPEEVELPIDNYRAIIMEAYKYTDFFCGPKKPTPPVKAKASASGFMYSMESEELAYDDPIYKYECERYIKAKEAWEKEQISGDNDFIMHTSGGAIRIKMVSKEGE